MPHLPVGRPTGRAELPELRADEARRRGASRSGDTVGRAAGAARQPARVAATRRTSRPCRCKDYHRVVRATYQATERPATGGGRVRAYLPFALLVSAAVVGAVVLDGHMSTDRRRGFAYPWIETMSGMIRIATMFVILIIGLIAGPAVSL